MRPPQEAGAGSINLMVVCATNRASCNEHDVPSWFDGLYAQSNCLTQTTFDPIALNRIPDPVANRKPKAAIREFVPQYAQHQLSVANGSSLTPDFLNPSVLANAMPSFHRVSAALPLVTGGVNTTEEVQLRRKTDASTAGLVCPPVAAGIYW
jgi:hypothetical protein